MQMSSFKDDSHGFDTFPLGTVQLRERSLKKWPLPRFAGRNGVRLVVIVTLVGGSCDFCLLL